MTTDFLSIGSLRALAAARRRDRLAGGTWSTSIDRDLDRVASDLLVLSQADADRLASASQVAQHPIAQAVHLDDRRGRTIGPVGPGSTPRARAS